MSRKVSRALVSRLASTTASVAAATLVLVASQAAALPPSPCIVPDNGGGTIDYPPNPCGFVTLQPLMIINDLPPGTTIECESTLDSFFDITYLVSVDFT